MKYLLGFILGCFILPISFQAQSLEILDEYGDPVEDAVIELESSQTFFLSNLDGRVKLPEINCIENITIYHPDFEDVEQSIDLNSSYDLTITLYQCSFNLDEIVVSASKFLEKKSLVPQYISTIHKQEIALQNAPTTAEILSNSGKVFVQKSQQGGGSPNVRGFEANKVLLVVDGVRMNNAIFRAGHLQNVINTDANSIDNIEVLYGSGSVTYGSDALGGVINISTERGEFSSDSTELKGKVYGRFATANQEKTAGFTFKVGKPQFSSLTSFHYSDFDDLRQGAQRSHSMGDLGLRPKYAIHNGMEDVMVENDNPNIQKYSGYTQYNFIQKLRFQVKENTIHSLNFHFSTSSDVPRYDRLSEINDEGNQKNVEWYYGPQGWLMASYQMKKNMNQKWADQMQLSVAYQKFKESRHTRKFNQAEKRHQKEGVDVLNFNWNWKKNWDKHSLKYGLESFYNYVNSEAHYENIYTDLINPTDTRYPDGGSTMASFASYVSHSQHFGKKKWYLSEGIRYTYTYLKSQFDDQSFFPFPYDDITQNTSNLSGFLGLIFLPQNDFRLSLNLNSGFRTPNVDDVGKVFDSTPGNVIVPNPSLKPERTLGSDFSISKVFGGVVKMESVFFYTSFQDIITTQNSTYLGTSTIDYEGVESQVQQQMNAGKAYIYGFNFLAEAKLNSFLNLKTHFTYTKGEVMDDENYPLDHIPPFYGKLNLQFKNKKWLTELYSIFNAQKPISQYNPYGEDNDKYATPEGMPAWWTLNFKTSYKWGKKGTVNLGLENILDRNYRVFSSGISAPGRNFIISFQYQF